MSAPEDAVAGEAVPDEVPLAGGRTREGVALVSGTVRRPYDPDRSPYVLAVLARLAAADVPGGPRPLGRDARGREVLGYLPGPTGHGCDGWSDGALAALGRLLRPIHDALSGSPEAAGRETVVHGDAAPWNCVLDDRGHPVGLFDFDDAAPGRRVDDLGYAAWVFLRLGEPGTPPPAEQGRRVRLLLAAYATAGTGSHTPGIAALPSAFRSGADAAQDRIERMRRAQADDPSQDPGRLAFARERAAEIAAQRAWLRRHGDGLAH